jgi:hypothetical protein
MWESELILEGLALDVASTPQTLPALQKLRILTRFLEEPDKPFETLHKFSGLRHMSIEGEHIQFPTEKTWLDLEQLGLIWGSKNPSAARCSAEVAEKGPRFAERLVAFLKCHDKIEKLNLTAYLAWPLLPERCLDHMKRELSGLLDETTVTSILSQAAEGLEDSVWEHVRAERIHAGLDRLNETEDIARAHWIVFYQYSALAAWHGRCFKNEHIPDTVQCSVTVRPAEQLERALQGNCDNLDEVPWDDVRSLRVPDARRDTDILCEIRSPSMYEYHKNSQV